MLPSGWCRSNPGTVSSFHGAPHPKLSELPVWGRQKGVGPICTDLPVFFRFALLVVRNAPICSDDFFRFLPISFRNKSEQIRETPFCRPLLQVPETVTVGTFLLPALNMVKNSCDSRDRHWSKFSKISGKDPSKLIQLVLTVLVFWSRALLVLKGFQLRLGAPVRAPEEPTIGFMALSSKFLDLPPQVRPDHLCKNGMNSTSFSNPRGNTLKSA